MHKYNLSEQPNEYWKHLFKASAKEYDNLEYKMYDSVIESNYSETMMEKIMKNMIGNHDINIDDTNLIDRKNPELQILNIDVELSTKYIMFKGYFEQEKAEILELPIIVIRGMLDSFVKYATDSGVDLNNELKRYLVYDVLNLEDFKEAILEDEELIDYNTYWSERGY